MSSDLDFYDLGGDSDELLKALLIGEITEVIRDEQLIVLTFRDGRRVALICDSFGLLLDDVGQC